METVRLPSSVTRLNCSKIFWCYPALNFSNEIQRLISSHDAERIACGKHNYMFKVLPSNTPGIIPFSFPDTNTLLELMPGESKHFYLKAAIREYVSTFNVFNAIGDRVYPEDIV